MILSLLLGEGGIRLRHLIRLMTASTVMLTPVLGYYVWAIHVSHAYPPYHVAAANNWVWDAGFGTWLKAGYFLPSVTSIAKLLWGPPARFGFRRSVVPAGKGWNNDLTMAFPLLVVRRLFPRRT
jgi:hypothetical protein